MLPHQFGGRTFLPPPGETHGGRCAAGLATDAGVHPSLEVLAGETSGWLHVLHRVKDGRDVFLVCNQNHTGTARHFKFRAAAAGVPECWDAMRNEITSIPFQRTGDRQAEFSLTLEPLESVLVVFQPQGQTRPPRIEGGVKAFREPMPLVSILSPAWVTADDVAAAMKNDAAKRHLDARHRTVSPIVAAVPFPTIFAIPADVDLAKTRVCLEMDGLPDHAASVTVNGVHAGGVIGRPLRLDITRHLKKNGENTLLIEPLPPETAWLGSIPAPQQDRLAL